MNKTVRRWLLAGLLCVALPALADHAPFSRLVDQEGNLLRVHISDNFPQQQRRDILAWIESIATSLADVYGHWPRQEWQISVESTSGASGDSIPWAQVRRGAVDEVEFFVLSSASRESLVSNWTGYHELAHLLIPYQGWGDAWFSEGLASYYQNLLQARSGVISETQMWQKLLEGFERGRNDTRFDGRTLKTVSAKMRSEGGFMRVYWSGAWYFLAADVQLRHQSGGERSLDTALLKLNDCCASASMSVPDMVARLDQLNNVTLFSDLYRQAVDSTVLPPYEPLYDQLAITITDGQVALKHDTPRAILRSAMAQSSPL